MVDDSAFLDHIRSESGLFLEAILQTTPETAVPTCPEWNADDLLWHLAEVQWFWGTIVQQRLSAPDEAERRKPARPQTRTELTAFFEHTSHALSQSLRETPPETVVWTWGAEQSVGFVLRRQAHEALIHRVDAELAAGRRSPVDTELASDGVDEALRVMYGGVPAWGRFTPTPEQSIRLQATDTGDSWIVHLGQFTGTDPESGTSYDEPDIHPAVDDASASTQATVAATAADLDCWLWHRPTLAPVQRSGDEQVLHQLNTTISRGIN